MYMLDDVIMVYFVQEGTGDDSKWKNLYDLEEPQSRDSSPPTFSGGFPQYEGQHEEGKADGKQGLENRDGPKVLPFEFVALEACLEAACSCLENEVTYLSSYFPRFFFTTLPLCICFLCSHNCTCSCFYLRQKRWNKKLTQPQIS